MRKIDISFRSVRAGSYLHRFFLGKKVNGGKHSNRSRAAKATVIAAAALSVSFTSVAQSQCNTFKNANAANPIIGLLDKSKEVRGFAFADIDGDGDQDVYVSYYDDSSNYSQPKALSFFRNVGTKQHPVFAADTATGFGTLKAGRSNEFMQFADIDGDGDLDYFVSNDAQGYYDNAGIMFYKNIGTVASPKFASGYPNPLAGVSSPFYQPFTLADMDGDGDYDMYASDISPYGNNNYNHRVYFNKGSKTNPVFGGATYNSSDNNLSRTYYDWNKDGLLDFFGLPFFGIKVAYNKNIGPLANPQYVNAPSESPNFKLTWPYRMLDINNDGVPEVFDYGLTYGTLSPIAVIKDSILQNGNIALYSLNQENAYRYRWELNGKTIAGANNYYIVPKKSGIYTLYVTSRCGTGVSLNYEFTKTNFAPVADSRMINGIDGADVFVKAYPNPFASAFTLRLTGKPCTVKVVDLAGRVVLSQATSAASLQVGQVLKPGIYLVQVWQGKEMIYKETVIKQ